MTYPLVSVIVPVYNVEDYISDCISSLLHQTYGKMEIILVDDGSSDMSGVICDQYADKYVNVSAIHKLRSGVSAARNMGLKLAKGDLIGFVDGDDIVCNYMYEVLVRDIVTNNSDISLCSYRRLANNAEIKDVPLNGHTVILNKHKALTMLLNGKLDISVCTKLFKKELVNGIRFHEGRRINEDKYYLFESLLRINQICSRDAPLYGYRIRDNSVSRSRFSNANFDCVHFSELIIDVVKKEYSQLLIEAYKNDCLTKLSRVRMISRSGAAYTIYKDSYAKYKNEVFEYRKKVWKQLPVKFRLELLVLAMPHYVYRVFVALFDGLHRLRLRKPHEQR